MLTNCFNCEILINCRFPPITIHLTIVSEWSNDESNEITIAITINKKKHKTNPIHPKLRIRTLL